MDPALTAAAIGVGGTVIVGIAGFWASVRNTDKTTALTLRAVELTEQGQVTDRYSRAVEQLGSDKLDVRIGAVYALERVARDSPRDHITVMDVLATFVRLHSHEQWPLAEPGGLPPEPATRPDVQAAVTAIVRRNREDDPRPSHLAGPNLAGANLAGANLTVAQGNAAANLGDADLTGADLTGAILTGANLYGAKLIDARLVRADLIRTKLVVADLTRANLTYARLGGADLGGANLTSADLTSADLEYAGIDSATKITGAILTGASLFAATFPEEWPVPEGWLRDPREGRLLRASQDTGDAAS